MENNTFDDDREGEGERGGGEDGEGGGEGGGTRAYQSDGGRGCYIEGEEVLVVAVRVKDGRVADWKGGGKGLETGEREREKERKGRERHKVRIG